MYWCFRDGSGTGWMYYAFCGVMDRYMHCVNARNIRKETENKRWVFHDDLDKVLSKEDIR